MVVTPFSRVQAPEPSREGMSLMDIMKLAAVAGDGDLWTSPPSLAFLDASGGAVVAQAQSVWPETMELDSVLSLAECRRIRDALEGVPNGTVAHAPHTRARAC